MKQKGSKAARRNTRRGLVEGRTWECSRLEERVLLAAVYPTASEQYLLQLINRARANPVAEVQRIAANNGWGSATPGLDEGLAPGTVDPGPRQPLAMNPFVLDAARKHEEYLFANPNTTDPHNEVVNGVTIGPADRVAAAGYPPPSQVGENIWTTATTPNAQDDLLRLEQQTFVDYNASGGTPGRGHRLNLLSAGMNEVGLGVKIGTMNGVNWTQVTQDYATHGQGSFLTGVAIQDQNNDQFYQPGEGLAGVTITATRTSDNKVFSTTTWDSGGYSLPIEPGTYNVTATGGTVGAPAPQTVTVTTLNVEVDFIAATATLSAPVITQQPQDTTPSLSSKTFSFSVLATGNPVPTVQWQVAPFQSNNFADIPGATSYTYSADVAKNLNGNQYRAVLTNSQGTVTTNPATLTVQNGTPLPVTITLRPQNQTVNAGDTVTFTAAATGYTKVSWQVLTPDGKFTPIAGATTPTLTFKADPSMNGNQYYVFFDNSTGGVSFPAKLTVNAAPAAPVVQAQPQTTAAPDGGTADLTTVATGFPDPNVQWQVDDGTAAAGVAPGATAARASSHWHDIPGGTGLTLHIPVSLRGGTHRYRAIISNGTASVTTAPATVTPNQLSALSDDQINLQTAASAAMAAIQTCARLTAGDVAALSADLTRLRAKRSQRALLSKLASDEAAARQTFTTHETATLAALQRAAAKVKREWTKLRHHPADASVAATLRMHLRELKRAADAQAAPADATACKLATLDQLAPLSAIAPSDVQLQHDLVAAETNAFNIGQALQAPMTIALGIVGRVRSDAQS